MAARSAARRRWRLFTLKKEEMAPIH